MAERHTGTADPGAPLGAGHSPEADFDRDINVRGIVLTAVGLVVVGVLSALAMWWLFVGVRNADSRRDRPLSPLPEARARVLPPEPRLQADPGLDMEELRSTEKRLLNRPEWLDRDRGTARIPIDVAMDFIARQGLEAAEVAMAGSGQPQQGAAGAAGQPAAGAGMPMLPTGGAGQSGAAGRNAPGGMPGEAPAPPSGSGGTAAASRTPTGDATPPPGGGPR